jgi:hypothetical protein
VIYREGYSATAHNHSDRSTCGSVCLRDLAVEGLRHDTALPGFTVQEILIAPSCILPIPAIMARLQLTLSPLLIQAPTNKANGYHVTVIFVPIMTVLYDA